MGLILVACLALTQAAATVSFVVSWNRHLNRRRVVHRSFPPSKDTGDLAFSSSDDSSAIVKTLWQWADAEECEGMESCRVSNHPDTGVRGLFATTNIDEGDYILAVPFTASILVHDSHSNTTLSDLVDHVGGIHSDVIEGASLLQALESHQERWSPYRDSLPLADGAHFAPTPDFWSKDHIEQLQVPRLMQESLQRKEEIALVAREMATSGSDLQWAVWVVRSRGFTTLRLTSIEDQDEEHSKQSRTVHSRTFLIPIVDMINHSNDASAELDVLEVPDSFDESLFALRAIRPIRDGDEIVLTYGTGHETCLDLLSRYGFWTPHNPADDNLDWSAIDPLWDCTLEHDLARLRGTRETDPMYSILKLRVYLKELQHRDVSQS